MGSITAMAASIGIRAARSGLRLPLLLLALAFVRDSLAGFSGSLSLTSNYFWRGYSKSDDSPALQGFIDYEHDGGFFAGTWLSQVDFDDQVSRDAAELELSPYMGWSFTPQQELRTELQLVRYFYDGDILEQSVNYNELYASAHYRGLLSAQLAWAPDAYNQGEATYDGYLSGRYPLTDSLQLSAGAGYFIARKVFEYNYYYWDAGLTWYRPWGGIDIRYAGGHETGGEFKTDWGYEASLVRSDLLVTLTIGF